MLILVLLAAKRICQGRFSLELLLCEVQSLASCFLFFTRLSTNAQVRSIRKQRRKWSVEDEATMRVAAPLTRFEPCPICSQTKSFLSTQANLDAGASRQLTLPRGPLNYAVRCFSLASFPQRDPGGRVYFAHPPQRPVKTFKKADNTLTCRELLLLIRHSKWLLPGPSPAMNGRSRIYCVVCPLCCIESD